MCAWTSISACTWVWQPMLTPVDSVCIYYHRCVHLRAWVNSASDELSGYLRTQITTFADANYNILGRKLQHSNADSWRTKLTTADGQWDLHSTYLGEWKPVTQWNAACHRCSVLSWIRRLCTVERTDNKSSNDSVVSLAKLHLLCYLDCTGVKLQPATCLQVSRLIPGGICGER